MVQPPLRSKTAAPRRCKPCPLRLTDFRALGAIMKIHVRRKHIEKGKWGASICPVALAFREFTGRRCWVSRKYIADKSGETRLPIVAQRFIARFDAGKPVKPFAFVLK